MYKEYVACAIKLAYDFFSGNLFGNIISFASLLIAVIAIIIGREKVSEIITEYRKKRCEAVFGYHTNMKIYIMRLKRLLSDSQGNSLKSLYLLSSNEELRDESQGFKETAGVLAELSGKILDYLSTESDQIPATVNDSELEEWDSLIEKLVIFLTDFQLYSLGTYLSKLNNKNSIENYHKEIVNVLNQMLKLINISKENFREELRQSKKN